MSDVTKLPKWAQSRITGLERDVRELTRLVETAVPDASVFVFAPAAPNFRAPIARGKDAIIFVTNGGVEFTVRLDGEGLSLHATSNRSSGYTFVRPYASNSIWFGEVQP